MRAEAKIQILDDKKSTSEVSAFGDLGIMPGGANKVEDENRNFKFQDLIIY